MQVCQFVALMPKLLRDRSALSADYPVLKVWLSVEQIVRVFAVKWRVSTSICLAEVDLRFTIGLGCDTGRAGSGAVGVGLAVRLW